MAAALLMLVEELKVDLPGEVLQPADKVTERHDNVGEAEYLRRTDGMAAEEAAAVAAEMTTARAEKEKDKDKEKAAEQEKAEKEKTENDAQSQSAGSTVPNP